MNLFSLTYRIILVLAIGVLGLSSCTNFKEELPECRLFVKFTYDYNLLSADAFYSQVNEVDLYVFDKEGKFLFKQSEQGAPLTDQGYLMEVVVPVGEYQFMAWAKSWVLDANGDKVDAPGYEIPEFVKGVTTIKEMKLKLSRAQSLVINKELEGLWYGDRKGIKVVNFKGDHYQTEVIDLVKDTNKVRFMFENTSAANFDVDNYTYEIIESNGYMDYDNSLLPDDVLSYQPYHTENASATVGIIELNTMRLMNDRKNHFVVKEKQTGDIVFERDLTEFFLALRLEEHKNKWGGQEYLDRKDTYEVVFFLAGSQTSPWLSVYVVINGWTWYIQREGIGIE